MIAPPRKAPTWVTCKVCGLEHTGEDWRDLALAGSQHIEATATEPAEVLELRNCRCGSTLALKWTAPK